MMSDSRDHLRKAAVLVASLDSEAADRLLEQLPSQAADVLRRTVASLGDVPHSEQAAVIDEFLRHGGARPPAAAGSAGPVELEAGLARRLGLPASDESPTADGPAPPAPSFHFLHEASTPKLASLLVREHPQTVALVLSHLPSQRAAELLRTLPAESQADVLARLVDLEELRPDILREVERGLESRIAEQARRERRQRERMAWAASLLDAVPSAASQRILEDLARHDAELAAHLRPRGGPSEPPPDWAALDDAALAGALVAVEPRVAALALAGTEPAQAARLRRLLPRRVVRGWPRPQDLAPIRLAEVDAARQQVLAVARGLAGAVPLAA